MGISSYKLGRRALELIGKQQSRFLVSEIFNDNLSNLALIALQLNLLIEYLGRPVDSPDTIQFDFAPS